MVDEAANYGSRNGDYAEEDAIARAA